MTVKITRPSIDIRGTLDELNKPSGIAGNAMLAAETPQEQFNLIGAGRRNLIINGGFDVWQRGTSFTPTGADYMADRWFMGGGDYACTATKQASTLPDGSEVNTMRISYTASGTNYIDLYQGIENFKALSGKTVTLSCWIKTNISSLSYRQYSTQQFGSVAVADGQWHKLVSTVQLGAITGVNRGANSPFFGPTSGGTIVTKSGDYFEITQFQLELGSVATPFEHRSYGEELALCQRYYQRLGGRAYTPLGTGMIFGNIVRGATVEYAQTMRAVPSIISINNIMASDRTVYDNPIISYSDSTAGIDKCSFNFNLTNTVSTSGYPTQICVKYSSVGYIEFDAEL